MNFSCYRNIFFPKYKMENYEKMEKIIAYLSEVETVIINFQDNDFDEQKMNRIDKIVSKTKIKTFVLRNLCYYME